MVCCMRRNVSCRANHALTLPPPAPPPSGQDPPGGLPLLPAHLHHPPPQVKIPLEGCPSCPRASITLQLSSDPWVYRPELAVRGALAMYRTPGPRTLVLQLLEGEGELLRMCVEGRAVGRCTQAVTG